MKSVCFLLPGRLYRPIGGHKIVYQHANYLSKIGYKVYIANNVFAPSNKGFIFETLRKSMQFSDLFQGFPATSYLAGNGST